MLRSVLRHEISWVFISFPSNAPIVRCVPIEGLTLQVWQCSYCIPTRTFYTLIANTSTYWQIHSVTVTLLQVWKFPWRALHCMTCLVNETKGFRIVNNFHGRCKHMCWQKTQRSDFRWHVVCPEASTHWNAVETLQLRHQFRLTMKWNDLKPFEGGMTRRYLSWSLLLRVTSAE